jgi:hypothetical protein
MPRNNAQAPLIAGDIVRLVISYSRVGQIYQTMLDYQADALGVVGAVELNSFITAWRGISEAKLQAVLPPTVALQSYVASLISGNVPPSQTQIPIATLGLAGVSDLPGEVAANAIKRSGLKGQHGRGRIQWPCIPNTFTTPVTDPNIINAAGLAAYATLHLSLTPVLAAAPRFYQLCISTRPVTPLAIVQRAVVVTGVVSVAVLGTQRRRKEGRGR